MKTLLMEEEITRLLLLNLRPKTRKLNKVKNNISLVYPF